MEDKIIRICEDVAEIKTDLKRMLPLVEKHESYFNIAKGFIVFGCFASFVINILPYIKWG
jgi:hypothetical protein